MNRALELSIRDRLISAAFIVGLFCAMTYGATEDLTTYTETDDTNSRLTVTTTGWSYAIAEVTPLTMRLTKDGGAGSADDAWSVTFRVKGKESATLGRIEVLVMHNQDASFYTIDQSSAEDADMIFVDIRNRIATGLPFMYAGVWTDGAFNTGVESSDFSSFDDTVYVTLTRTTSSGKGHYVISAKKDGTGTELFASGNSFDDNENNTWRYRSVFSTREVSTITGTRTPAGSYYEFTGLTEGSPKAYNPSPSDTTAGIAYAVELSWTAGTGAVSHDVYFGATSEAVESATTESEEYIGNQEGTTYDPTGDLDPLTTYYWRVDEIDDEDNVTTGDVWSFTTRRQTYYIGASHTGDYSGSSRSNLMTPAEFMAIAEPGDTALWQPGNYGNVLIDDGYGTSAGGYVTHKADPDTCTPRGSTWWSGDIDPPSSSEAPILSRLWIASYGVDGTPTGHWVWIEGLSICPTTANQPMYFYQLVDHVMIKDCSLWGVVPSTWPYSESNELSVGIEMDAGAGNHNSHITFDGVYVEGCATGWTFKYDGHDVLLTDCRVNKVYSQCMTFWDDVTLDHCHISGEAPVADSGNIMAGPDLAIASVGSPANTTFTHTGDHVANVQYVRVEGGSDNELRKVSSYTDSTIVLATALSFNMDAEVHTVTLYNQTHGSALNLWDSGVTIRNCIIHDISGTGLCYLYTGAITNITLENNLFYDCANPDHIVDFTTNGDMGNNFRMVNNTVISTRSSNYPSDISNSTYGKAMLINLQSGSDGSTWTVTNNVFVGAVSSMPAGAVVKNNILYAGSTFEEDEVGDNQGNLVYYASEAYPNEPHPFESGFFATGTDWSTAFTTWHHRDYNAAFVLVSGSPAVDAGSATEGEFTETDLDGTERDASPDVGFDEYVDGTAPSKATEPSPANEATGVALDTALEWTAGENAETHSVYFGTSSGDLELVEVELETATYSPTLTYSTTYYWRIDEVGNGQTTTGDEWSFTTTDAPRSSGRVNVIMGGFAF